MPSQSLDDQAIEGSTGEGATGESSKAVISASEPAEPTQDVPTQETAAPIILESSAVNPTQPAQSNSLPAAAFSKATPSPPRPSTGQKILKTFLWTGLFGATAAASALLGAVLALSVPLPGEWLPQQSQGGGGLGELWQSGFRYRVSRPVNLLLMGIDEVPEAEENSQEVFTGRTDTLLLVRVEPQAEAVNVLSIPRDTQVRIPGYGTAKINHANVEGGPELVAQTLNYNLGSVPVDRYVRVSTGAFREIVDLVGGVEVYVPKRMVYEDRTQGLYIDLYPGLQTLNGDQAEQFARFRKDETGDIGRVQRQQMLLKALRQRLTSPAVIPKLPQIIRVLQRYIDTNLSVEEMLALANFALSLQPDNLNMVMLPGRFSEVSEYNASYWLADADASARIMQDFFEAEPLATLAGNGAQVPAELSIAVQNASESRDVAREVASYLRDQGFYNVYVTGDWPMVEPRTQIIAQRGDISGARTLRAVLETGQVIADSTGDLQSDITIRVGEDWLEQLGSAGYNAEDAN
ncbi:MAG TPA: LCP family protein [Trichocoleus sp.]